MKHLLHSLETAVATDNHYAALSLALAIPDICGWIKNPKTGSKARCVEWFERYMQPTYTTAASVHNPEHVFLTGSDFYALRCAYLHEGRDEIIDQQAQKILQSFQFVVPPKGWRVHRNQNNDTLQLQVDIFCREIGAATEKFLAEIAHDNDALRRMNQLLLIRDINGRPLQGEA